MPNTYDVVIVGAGGSGLAAAVSAAEHGASVVALEKLPQVGGTTAMAIGSFSAAGTALQQRAGVADSVDDHEADTALFAPALDGRNNADLRRHFLAHNAATLDWLMRMGLAFYGPAQEPPNRVPRMHNAVPAARSYVTTLHAQLVKLGGAVLCNAPAVRLMQNGGRVTGVVARVEGNETEFVARRGVILAAGYYPTRQIDKFRDARFAQIDHLNHTASGDGHRLAQEAGGQLVNLDVAIGPAISFIRPPDPASPYTWQHPTMRLFDDGAVMVNANGQRFVNERATPEREIALSRQPDKVGYILLDARLSERYSRWPHYVSTAPGIAYAYVPNYIGQRPDVAVAAVSLAALAARRGLPTDALQQTVAQFNRYVGGSAADPFGRTGDAHPLTGDTWLLLGPAKAYFSNTEGCVRINRRFQVVNPAGGPIPGLYAVGQNGLGGQILMAHGQHIAWAMTSGRLAGQLLATGQMDV